jgi:hypothetical protein
VQDAQVHQEHIACAAEHLDDVDAQLMEIPCRMTTLFVGCRGSLKPAYLNAAPLVQACGRGVLDS